MTRRHQIIDRLPDDAEDTYAVLFDFDEYFTVSTGTNISPPEMRYATSSTFLQDGENVDASAFNNRVLALELGAMRGNAEVQAEALQILGRLLADPRGQWFLWQDEGTVHPRYFNTLPSSMAINDLLVREDPKRVVTVNIPAKPFAQGDLVEASYVVKNDPISGTHPMVIVLSDVQGDVPTPVWMSVDYSATDITARNLIVAGSSTPAGVAAGLVLFDTGEIEEENSWTRTVVSDGTAIGGSLIRYTPAELPHPPTITTKATVTGVEPGDYRILMRARANLDDVDFVQVSVWPGIGDSIDVPAADTADVVEMIADWQWIDAGITRMPGGSPEVPDRTETDLTYSIVSAVGVRLRVAAVVGTHYVDVDTVMLVPAGLDRANQATMLRTRQIPTLPDTQAWIDGINDTTYLVDDDTVGSTTAIEPLIADGDTPMLVPGSTNRLFVIPDILNPLDPAPVPDDHSDTVTVKIKYRAQYLYIRSATG